MTQPTPTPDPTLPQQKNIKLLYWIAAAALAVAIILEIVRPPVDYMKIGSRAALLIALVLLATARPAETKWKKVLIYALVVVAAVLLVWRIAG